MRVHIPFTGNARPSRCWCVGVCVCARSARRHGAREWCLTVRVRCSLGKLRNILDLSPCCPSYGTQGLSVRLSDALPISLVWARLLDGEVTALSARPIARIDIVRQTLLVGVAQRVCVPCTLLCPAPCKQALDLHPPHTLNSTLVIPPSNSESLTHSLTLSRIVTQRTKGP